MMMKAVFKRQPKPGFDYVEIAVPYRDAAKSW